MDKNDTNPVVLPHHVPGEFCRSRAVYRQGRNLTAVKVYTVSKESSHLLIFNVPAINLSTELQLLCERYGKVTIFEKLNAGLELEEFTEVFHVNYLKVPSARYAKKHLDNRSFYGGFLHVCYAPERETVEETRIKLITRRNEIAVHTGRKVKTKNMIPVSSSSKSNSQARMNNLKLNQDIFFHKESIFNSSVEESPVKLILPNNLIPTSVKRKETSKLKEPPKKIPKIIFHKNCESK